MISRTELTNFLNGLLLAKPWNDYGPNGLQVEGSEQISRIATAVSANLETIEAAIEWGAQALVVHHGLFWKADEMRLCGWMARRVNLLLQNQLSLYAYHLPLDVHPEVGNNWGAALDLKWKQLQPFGSVNGVAIGVRGEIDLSIRALKQQLEAYYGHSALHCAGGPDQITRVALVSGTGYRAFQEAIDSGVQCLITGVVDEPVWHWAREGGVHVLALGHCATEKVGPIKLATCLHKKTGIECRFLDIENPL
jgi:dinuclear metal center YbgI/SA1388 family protein